MDVKKDLGKISVEIDGRTIECDILSTFECEELNKMYIVYTNHEIESNGKEKLYINSYDPVIGLNELMPVTTPEEVEMVMDVLKEIALSN